MLASHTMIRSSGGGEIWCDPFRFIYIHNSIAVRTYGSAQNVQLKKGMSTGTGTGVENSVFVGAVIKFTHPSTILGGYPPRPAATAAAATTSHARARTVI